jgi:hypothetical protein
MIKNRSIARDLYIIGTINALTGYYDLHYTCEENKVSNKVNFDCGIEIGSEISIKSEEDAIQYNMPNVMSDYSIGINNNLSIPYIKEIDIITVDVKKGDSKFDPIYIEKTYIGNNFDKVISSDSSFEEKQRFLLESLDRRGRRKFILPKNNIYIFSKEEAKELEFIAIDMQRWLEYKVREETEAKKLVK